MLITILILVFAYVLGSISSAILLCRIICLVDPRNYESKNPGATNVFRIAGYRLAILVMLFDFLKGFVSIWLGFYFEISYIYVQMVALAVCLGHMYPIFFQFSGGKGVSTTFGVLSAINFNFFIVMISIWLLVLLLFRYISLASIIAVMVMPFCVWYLNSQYCFLLMLLSLLVLFRHRSNIKRLWFNQEKKIWNR